MLPDSQIMTQNTSLGEILASGVSRHYCGNLALRRRAKDSDSQQMVQELVLWERSGDRDYWREGLSQLIRPYNSRFLGKRLTWLIKRLRIKKDGRSLALTQGRKIRQMVHLCYWGRSLQNNYMQETKQQKKNANCSLRPTARSYRDNICY